jgi:lambda repressor-like predicted transcriptional regulator
MSTWHTSPEGFAEEVLTVLKADERSIQWLSRQTGIAGSTLRSQLLDKPSRLTLLNAIRISEVTGVAPLAVAA